MSTARMLVGLRIEGEDVSDLSSTAHAVRAVGVSGHAGYGRLKGDGRIEVARSKALDDLGAFTIELAVQPDDVDTAMVLLDAQSPPITLRMEPRGVVEVVLGQARRGAGLRLAGNQRLAAGERSTVRLLRDERGHVTLEIKGEVAAEGDLPGALTPRGDAGITLGAAVDGSHAFRGEIGYFRILNAALSAAEVRQRLVVNHRLVTRLRDILGGRVTVEPDPGAVDHRLDGIKSVLATLGVDDLSQLSTLRITEPTTIHPGQVMVAPRKVAPLDWSHLAQQLGVLAPAQAMLLRDGILPNVNSVHTLALRAPPGREVPGREVPERIRPGERPPVGKRRPAGAAPEAAHAAAHEAAHARAERGPMARLEREIGAPMRERIRLAGLEAEVLDRGILDDLQARQPALWPVMDPPPAVYAMMTIPVQTAVIIAGTLDLTDTELRIEPTVETLYIIAEEVICGPGARISWRRPGGSTPARADDPGLNGQSWSGVHTAEGSKDGLHGGDGGDGAAGEAGAEGTDAPNLEMWVKRMTALPDIDLRGEKGISGGRGQRGGRGGNGARGQEGLWWWFFGVQCWEENGHGGDGGDGGNGGRGGRGGNGGHGGQLLIGVLEGTLAATVTAQQFRLNNSGGEGGDGGAGGSGGAGGQGGSRGWAVKDGEWYCDRGRDGHDGAQGQPGAAGADGHDGADGHIRFMEFTEESWNEQLSKPWLHELTPTEAFPGTEIQIKGSLFADTDRVIIGTTSFVPTLNPDQSIRITLPTGIAGGEHELFLRRFDGRESNRLRFWVKPQLLTAPPTLAPGASVGVSGRAFVNGADVIYNGSPIEAAFVSSTQLTFTVPSTGGVNTTETSVTLAVRNPDGRVSNTTTAQIPQILDYGWRLGVHDYSFANFSLGDPSWSTFEDTFGALEVWHELLDPVFGHPILTAAFYGFYHYFLLGSDGGGLATGFCTSLASTAAERFWSGHNDTFTAFTLDTATRQRLTAVHGKLLSRETLTTMHDQGREGTARVTTTFRAIEARFRDGMDRESAPLLFFTPSGAAWDSGYFDRLASSHCVVPIRIVYPIGSDGTDLDGVEIYVWDNNHPHSTGDAAAAAVAANCRVVLRRVGTEIRFSYFDGGATALFQSEDGVTLGTMSVGQYLLADHDMPFSGPLGLTTFVLDFLLSPADLQAEDSTGRRTGRFGSQLLAEIPDSHPCYLAKGAWLLPMHQALTRRIVGTGAGTYAWHSLDPAGHSISLEGVSTTAGEVDRLDINADGTQIRITPGSIKTYRLNLARRVEGQVRAISVEGLSGGPGADIDITLSPELSVLRIGNKAGDASAAVRVMRLDEGTQAHQVIDQGGIAVPLNNDLVVSIADWNTTQVTARALPFGA